MQKIKHSILFLLVGVCIVLSSFKTSLQSIDEVVQTFKVSMSSRDAKILSDYFANTVDLTYSNNHSTYTKSHAIIILNDFFNKNHPTSFRIDYRGASPHSDAQYVIGTAHTDNGIFRVYLYIRNKGGKLVVEEIRIAK